MDLALLRDVVERHGVTNLAGWRWLVRHLLGHPAAMCSVEKCYVALKSRGIAISKDPLYQLLGFLEDCYLLHPPGRAAVEAQIVAKAQGNPCFLGELPQALGMIWTFSGGPNCLPTKRRASVSGMPMGSLGCEIW